MKQPNQKSQSLLVETFNSLYPVGEKAPYRSSPVSEYRELTVRDEAFITNGMAVVFFEEKSGYYSIEKCFVKYPKP